MLDAGAVHVVGLVGREHDLPAGHHVVRLALQGNVEPGGGRQTGWGDVHRRRQQHPHAFDIRLAGLEPIDLPDFLQLQSAVEEAGATVHVPIAQALALVNALEPGSKVMLPGAGIDGDAGQLLGTGELDQDIARDVVAQLQRRDIAPLLLQGNVGYGE